MSVGEETENVDFFIDLTTAINMSFCNKSAKILGLYCHFHSVNNIIIYWVDLERFAPLSY